MHISKGQSRLLVALTALGIASATSVARADAAAGERTRPLQPSDAPSGARASAPRLVIESLSGPVTRHEIDAFKAYVDAQSPPRTPWGSSHNAWAFGSGGRNLEAMGMMYEISGDLQILNQMIRWADECVSQRNDLMPAEKGGQRVMWTGRIEKVWCPESATHRNARYAGCETEDAIAHMVYCAKLILQHPELWKTSVPDGNPHGYGTTYKDRALNYISKCDEANDEYFVKWFIRPDTYLIREPENQPAWRTFNNNLNAINRQMMFNGGFQRLAECHEILGDAPERVQRYDAVVKASITECLQGIKTFQPGVVNGHKVYNWHYYPWSDDTRRSESTGHAAYDVLGLYRAFQRSAYSLKLEDLTPIANTMAYVIYKGSNTFAVTVDGKGALRSFTFGEFMLLADWNPDVYHVIGKSALALGSYARNANFTASILYMKHRRAAGLCPAKTASQITTTRGA
jgi:hypothetical protein